MRVIGLLAFAVLLAPPVRGADVYRWTDANGVVHFSDAPPQHGNAERQTLPPPEPMMKGGAAPAEAAVDQATPGADAAASGTPAANKGPAAVVLTKQDEGDLGEGRHSYRGAVKNTGGSDAHGVSVAIRVTETSQGDQCLQEDIPVQPSTLAPGEVGHFDAELSSPCFYGATQAALEVVWD